MLCVLGYACDIWSELVISVTFSSILCIIGRKKTAILIVQQYAPGQAH